MSVGLDLERRDKQDSFKQGVRDKQRPWEKHRSGAVGSGSGPNVPLQRVWVLTLHIIFKRLVPGVETALFKTPQPDCSADCVPF